MATTFSFDIVSDFDVQEMNNALDQARREINNRYDFKGSAAAVEFVDDDKKSLKIIGDNQYQLDAVLDIVRKKAAGRDLSQKIFDVKTHEAQQSGMTMTWIIPLVSGLDQDKAKKITKLLRDTLPKVKTQIQGEEVRVTSQKKDELQHAMDTIREAEFAFPLNFTNYR